jgi:hypothetical protein
MKMYFSKLRLYVIALLSGALGFSLITMANNPVLLKGDDRKFYQLIADNEIIVLLLCVLCGSALYAGCCWLKGVMR